MDRRRFLSQGATAALAGLALPRALGAVGAPPATNPRWYGFNLLEFFSGRGPQPFREQDFEIMAEWGFSFARIPMSYWNWSRPALDQWLRIDEAAFAHIDRLLDYGRSYRIHINLNLHRIPGYCVNNTEAEPLQLFTGPEEGQRQALAAAAHHWTYIASRYKGVPSTQLSFDLINEPPSSVSREKYLAVIRQLTAAVRAIDPGRRIVVDGFEYGNIPIQALAGDPEIFQSTHGYVPMQLTHYKASWVGDNSRWPEPTWPLQLSDNNRWDRARLEKHFQPWDDLNRRGVPVHVGEWGVYNRTPHGVTLAFMRDQLSLWKARGWGWSLWNLRGSFGVLDSGRGDVTYESYKGHRLDRRMLETLREGLR